MTAKVVLGIMIAGLAGYFGGFLGSRCHVEAAQLEVIKASKFELVNGLGVTVGTWEVDSKNAAHLRFLGSRDRASIEVGVRSDGTPVIEMSGRDGKRRITLSLSQFDKPMLLMGDERWEGRIHLGFVEPDTFTPEWDNWGLLFNGLGSQRPVVGMGMAKGIEGQLKGVIALSGKNIR